MNFEYTCPDCVKRTSVSSTGDAEVGDDLECPWCGRVSKITEVYIYLTLEPTEKKNVPSEWERFEAWKKEHDAKEPGEKR